ncbi:hypothetical protein B0H19DRAFT_1253874 [Mycena capillaripes]|nr:hypothetical protein B0H19DRAFT_1253874 [Mycena capillaripes]
MGTPARSSGLRPRGNGLRPALRAFPRFKRPQRVALVHNRPRARQKRPTAKSCPPAAPILPKGGARHVMNRPFYCNPRNRRRPPKPSPVPCPTAARSTPSSQFRTSRAASRNLPLPINHAAAIKIFGSATLLTPPSSRSPSPTYSIVWRYSTAAIMSSLPL